MCFNNAKNWQLGWYADRRAIAKPLESPWEGTLVGFAEYDVIPETSDSVVILKVQGDDVDYYVGFNRRTGINSGTVEGGNQVTIQSRNLGTTNYVVSVLVAKLSSGRAYTISDFAGETVTIEVLSINTSSSPGVASVQVYKGAFCPSITSNRTCKRADGCRWQNGSCIRNQSTGPTAPTPTAPTPTAPAPTPTVPTAPTAPTGGCSSNSCSFCSGGGACKSAGCSWSKGICS